MVNDDVLIKTEVGLAVKGMKRGRAGSPSCMRAEELKEWRKEAKREKECEGIRWEIFVRLMQVVFRDRTVPVGIAW